MQRWFSARIGEGLIFDLRTKVFAHVQRMPVAFFTRTQTGALVSRLNNDVIGAQQAFTSTLSGVVSNVISLILVVGAMLVLSWQLTLVAILLLPVFLIPARILGRRLASMTREQMNLNADDVDVDDRAVQRRRRAAGDAVRPAVDRERASSASAPARCATSASGSRCSAGCSSLR